MSPLKKNQEKQQDVVLTTGDNVEMLPTVEQAITLIKAPVTDKIRAIAEKALEVDAKSITSIASYNTITKNAKDLTSLISTIEAKRKELIAPALAYQRDINEEAKAIKLPLEKAKDHLKGVIKLVDDEKARQEQELRQERIQKLSSVGFMFDGYHYTAGDTIISAENITALTDDEFQAAYDIGAAFIQEKLAKEKAEREAREAEQKRLDQERAELERQRAEIEKERAELAQLRAEKAAAERKAQAPKPDIEDPNNQPIFKQPAQTTPAPSFVEKQVPDLAPMYEPEEPIINEDEFTSHLEDAPDLFNEGFQHCKLIILQKFNSGVKMKRPEWVQWISALEPKQ